MREKLRERWRKSTLKTWLEGKAGLRRGTKTVIQFGIILLVGIWLWGLAGYPLPTVEMRFRRLERTWLEGPSELVFQTRGYDQRFQAAEGVEVYLDRPAAVGLLEDRALVGMTTRSSKPLELDALRRSPLEKGPSPVPVAGCLLWEWNQGERGAEIFDGSALLLVRMPPEAAEGTLVLEGTYREWDYRRDCPLFRLEDGVWLARVEQPEVVGYPSDWYVGAAYTLRLYDGAGELLLEQSGTVPEEL